MLLKYTSISFPCNVTIVKDTACSLGSSYWLGKAEFEGADAYNDSCKARLDRCVLVQDWLLQDINAGVSVTPDEVAGLQSIPEDEESAEGKRHGTHHKAVIPVSYALLLVLGLEAAESPVMHAIPKCKPSIKAMIARESERTEV